MKNVEHVGIVNLEKYAFWGNKKLTAFGGKLGDFGENVWSSAGICQNLRETTTA